MAKCGWCEDPNAEDFDEDMCDMHYAEYLGISEDELERYKEESNL